MSDLRDQIAEAAYNATRGPGIMDEPWGWARSNHWAAQYLKIADAVLAVLGQPETREEWATFYMDAFSARWPSEGVAREINRDRGDRYNDSLYRTIRKRTLVTWVGPWEDS